MIRERYQHLAILSVEADSFKEAVELALKRHVCLSTADLSDLLKTNLHGVNLYGANLSRSTLAEADLSDANLYATDFSGADLSHANLEGTDLSHSNLCGALMTKAAA